MPDVEATAEALAIENLVEQYVGAQQLAAGPPRIVRSGAFSGELAFTGESADAIDEVWETHFDSLSLQLPSAVPGIHDPYERELVVRTSGERLLEVRASCRDCHESTRVSPDETAEQLRENQESYLGLPAEPPRITFMQAVDRVLAEGIGSPFDAKEIDGFYVQHARDHEEPHPVWIIELRGLPPYAVKGPPGVDSETVPHWQRNHMRNVVDARTGRVLYADNLPQPSGG